jgi:hypothetical protein
MSLPIGKRTLVAVIILPKVQSLIFLFLGKRLIMKIKTISLLCAITLGLALFSSHPVYAVSTLSLYSSGNGVFTLQGNGMDNVAAMDITITYDASTLSNPQVTKEGLIADALMAFNPNVPGIVRMGIITTSPIQGSGTIITLAFKQDSSSPGKITGINAIISNSNGNQLPVVAQIVNPSNEPLAALTAPSNAGTQPGATAPTTATPEVGRQIVIGGGLCPQTIPREPQKEPVPIPEAIPEPAKEKPVVSQETASYPTGTVQSAQPAGQNKKNIYTQKSVLERFREYKGEPSVKSLTELFNQEPLIGFRQDPGIVHSDGKAAVKISLIAMTAGKKTPDIQITGATLLSLNKDPDNTNTWIAELRPDKKAIAATLVVSQEKVKMEFPIVVAPVADVDLDKSGTVTEADFKMFLHDRGSAKKPQFDLNNDGKRDFVDDYIFTANYIIKKHIMIK